MNLRHGGKHTRAYGIWASMLSRCNNPNVQAFADYGGRGIAVCARWKDFAAFREDMGDPPPRMTLDRRDNDQGYSPANCRWATRTEQSRNRRNVRRLTVDGETLTMSEWAERTGLKLGTIHQRLRKGWPLGAAVKTPLVTNRAGKPRGYVFFDGSQSGGEANKLSAGAAI